MPYLNFTNALTTDTVNEATQINANWDQIDSKMNALVVSGNNFPGAGVVAPEEGMESVNPSKNNAGVLDPWPTRIGVYNGTSWRQQSDEVWGAWETITLTAPFVARPSFIPQLQVSNAGTVRFRGGVQNAAANNPWPTGMQIINSGQFASATYDPDQLLYESLPTSVATPPTWSYALAKVEPNITGFMRLSLQFLGSTGGGNFIQLEGLKYYTGAVLLS